MRKWFRGAVLAILLLIVFASAILIGLQYKLRENEKQEKFRALLLDGDKNAPWDCLKDREYSMLMGGLHDTGNVPTKKGCPGYVENQNPDFGTYSLGPHTFKIPRPYLWLSRYDADGAKDALYLMFHYPDMTPGDANAKDRSANIDATIKYLKEKCKHVSKNCDSYLTSLFKIESEIEREKTIIDFNKAKFDGELNLFKADKSFKLDNGELTAREDIFYRGYPENPEYWIVCAVKENSWEVPHCKSAFYFEEGIVVDYTFRKSLLTEHDKIRQKINDSLRKFFKK